MNRRGFTLLELLVVVGIIAVLVSILLPALSSVRDRAKNVVCMNNLRQIGLSLKRYADDFRGEVPRGAQTPTMFVPTDMANNMIWYGKSKSRCGLGILLGGYLENPRLLFCPADGRGNQIDELPKIGTDNDAYSSYLYRNADDVERPLLYDPGLNGAGMQAKTWVMDVNSLGQGSYYHLNHDGKRVHLLQGDCSLFAYENRNDMFSIRAEDFADYLKLLARLDTILRTADADGNPVN